MTKAIKRVFRYDNVIYLLLLPSLAGLAMFYVVPFGISMYYAVIDNSVSREFVGLANLIETWNNLAFRLAVNNTLLFMGASIPLNMFLALMLALVLRPLPKMARRVLLLFFLLPLVIPSGSVIGFWGNFIAQNGMFNRMFFPHAPADWIPIDWLNSPHAMVFVIVIFIWKNIGFNVILFQAGLDFIPKDYYEFASMEGAGRLWKFTRITLVYLGPTFLLVFLMSVVNSFKAFREVYLLVGRYPYRPIYLMQHFLNNQFERLNYQLMASASFFTFGFIFIVVLVMYFFQQRQTYL